MALRSIARGVQSDNLSVVLRALRRLTRLIGRDSETNERTDDWQHCIDQLSELSVLDALLSLVEHQDPTARELAVDALANWPGERALGALMKLSQDEVNEVRASAVGGLEEWPETLEATDILVAAVEDSSWPVRWRAARALGCHMGRDAEDALFVALLDDDSNVRCAAGEALEHHNSDRVRARLRGYFDYPSPHMLDAALDLFGAIGTEDDAQFLAKVGSWMNLSQPSQVKRWSRDASKRIRARANR
ncbi:MAG TPA: hypothetical protein DCQ06_00030 [Myxococcales bacterium]|nr:hypothetical protein [Myxococcales bacterium]